MVAEDVVLLPEALVVGEQSAAALDSGRTGLYELGGAELVERLVAEFADNQELGREVDALAPLEAPFLVQTLRSCSGRCMAATRCDPVSVDG